MACDIKAEKEEERSSRRAADSCWLEKKFAEYLAARAVREHLLELVLAEKEKCGEVVAVLKCESRVLPSPSGELDFWWRSMDVSGKLFRGGEDDQKRLADAGYPSAWNEKKLEKVLTDPHCEPREMVEVLKKLGVWCFDVTGELRRLGLELMAKPQRYGRSYEKLEMLAVDALTKRCPSTSFFLMLQTSDLMSGLGEKIAVVGTLKHG